jgi:sarcosine oxidase gamma subunit
MVNPPDPDRVIEADGVTVTPRAELLVASLRYFDDGGDFAAAVAGVVGGSLPRVRHCVRHGAQPEGGEIVLASCNPTETLALFGSPAILSRIEAFCTGRPDGCVVDLTGGVWACDIQGARAADLLARIGADARLPEIGEARTTRLADLPVTSIRVDDGALTLVVDRAYAEHLCAWIRETLGDFTASDGPD